MDKATEPAAATAAGVEENQPGSSDGNLPGEDE